MDDKYKADVIVSITIATVVIAIVTAIVITFVVWSNNMKQVGVECVNNGGSYNAATYACDKTG